MQVLVVVLQAMICLIAHVGPCGLFQPYDDDITVRYPSCSTLPLFEKDCISSLSYTVVRRRDMRGVRIASFAYDPRQVRSQTNTNLQIRHLVTARSPRLHYNASPAVFDYISVSLACCIHHAASAGHDPFS